MSTETEASPVVAIDNIVAKYVQLRDKKAEIEAKAKAEVAEINRALEKCEIFLLQKMQEQGLEALPTAFGTAYKQTKHSYSVADWDSFLTFVRQGEHWAMLERRAAKKAVDEYRDEESDLPPGLNARSEVVVNVRRS